MNGNRRTGLLAALVFLDLITVPASLRQGSALSSSPLRRQLDKAFRNLRDIEGSSEGNRKLDLRRRCA